MKRSTKISKLKSVAVAVPPHLSGALLATGRARFIADEPKPSDLCYVKVITSPIASGEISALNLDKVRTAPGVIAVLTAKDIPGENQIGSKIKDEPLLAERAVNYVGQPIAIIVAETEKAASHARALAEMAFDEREPILTITDALKKNSYLAEPLRLERGNVDSVLAAADFVLHGTIKSGSQEHLYFETQRCRAIPGEDQEITLYSATQAPTEVQEIAARVLGLRRKDITVDVRRLGGGFGGKESLANLWASLAALACFRTMRAVELKLTRAEDMAWTGKRHPFETHYRVGFDRHGKILAYTAEFNADGGAFADLTMPIIQRALLHADNAYQLPAVRLIARPLKTNLPPNTAFRGFGAPQGILAVENAIERIAFRLKKDPLAVRKLNAYRENDLTPYGQTVAEASSVSLLNRVTTRADYKTLRREIDAFNREQRFVKRGIGIVPVKFGISFTAPFLNQASALIHLYTDGSLSVSHGGVEMGQEVNTKVAQIVAAEFGVDLDRVRIESHNTKRTANTSPTAASTGADLNGQAARFAAQHILARLKPLAAELLAAKLAKQTRSVTPVFRDNIIFDERFPKAYFTLEELAHAAWLRRIDLSAHGFYKTPGLKFDWKRGRGTPFAYFVFGACLVVAEVDILTGNVTLPQVYIVHETAASLNPGIDRGQIEGAFIQSVGWCTMEEVQRDARGRCLTRNLTTYKIPSFGDQPRLWDIELRQPALAHASVKGSKAVGEPPFIYGEAAFFAVKNAVESLADHHTEIFLPHPATPEAIIMAVESLREPQPKEQKDAERILSPRARRA